MLRTYLQQHARPLIVITIALCFSHGLLLLNDGIFYDSWWVNSHLHNNRIDLLFTSYKLTSQFDYPYFHGLIGNLPGDPFVYRALVFISLWASAWLIYILQNFIYTSQETIKLFIAIFSQIYPAYQATTNQNVALYSITYAIFLAGCWLAFKAFHTQGLRSLFYKVISWLSFFYSYTTGAILVFHFGFVLLFIWHIAMHKNAKPNLATYLQSSIASVDYVALPFLYWGVTRVFFPANAGYILVPNYNQPTLENTFNVMLWVRFINASIIQILAWSLDLIGNWYGIVVIYLLYRWVKSQFITPTAPSAQVRQTYLPPFAFGFILLFFAMFPYVSVGKIPNTFGVETRFALLIGLPVAVLIITGLRVIFSNVAPNIPIFVITLCALTVAFTFGQIQHYVTWQARWAKDRSIMLNLSNLPSSTAYDIVMVDDKFSPPPNDTVAWALRFYAPFEWTAILQRALDLTDKRPVSLDTHRFYLSEVSKPNDTMAAFLKEMLLMGRYNPLGCQAKLTILNGERTKYDGPIGLNSFDIAMRYWYFNYLQPSQLNTFLRDITILRLEPVITPLATQCKS